jgi:hypothetical protein
MHIQAKILYDQIRAENPEDGLYVWVDPDESGVLVIQEILKGAPFDTVNTTDYHATVLYHKGKLPVNAVMPHDRVCHARIKELVIWEAHDGESIIVALLDSPALQAVHAALLAQGLTHSFPDFNAHVTVGKRVKSSPAVRLWLDKRNDMLAENTVVIGFDPRLKGASLAD